MIIQSIIIILLNVNNIDEINRLTKEAEIYFKNEEYDKSIINYNILVDSFDIKNEKIFLNLAHSYYLNRDTTKALENYTYATITDNYKVKSIALQQIGNISNNRNKLEEALEFYKESIISDNTNIDSKFNYELVKKKIQKQKQNEKQNKKDSQKQNKKDNKQENSDNKKNEDEGNKDQQENQQKNDSKDNSNKQKNKNSTENESLEEKLQKINMSKKKAEMILNALNNNEFQYIQQLKRKPNKKKDNNKPDW